MDKNNLDIISAQEARIALGVKRDKETKEDQKDLVDLYLTDVHKESHYTYEFSLNKVAKKLSTIAEFKDLFIEGMFPDAHALKWYELRNRHTTLIRKWLLETSKPTSAHKDIAPVRGILAKAYYDLSLMSADDYNRAIRACIIKVPKQPTAATGRMLTEEELDALLATCEKGNPSRATRDKAIISIFRQVGARLAEVTKLDLADYSPDFSPDAGRLIICGKGSKLRTAYVKNGVRDALNAWIKIRGNADGPLFYNILMQDEPFARRIAPRTIYQMLLDRGNAAGLEHFTPHDLRRSFASRLMDDGVDIVTIADLMGHSDVAVTAGYSRRPEKRKIDAIK
ncbi:MAG: tyrosine-type recombinase/integrase [Anaerolineales bacterium]